MTEQQNLKLKKAQAQIRELEKTIKSIQKETNKPKKWEPKEGYYHLYRDASIGVRSSPPRVEVGMRAYTKEQAELVTKELRKATRMWAYKMEFDAGFVPDWDNSSQYKYYPYYDCYKKEWFNVYSEVVGSRQGLPHFSKQAGTELADKLNSGEVEF